MLSRRITTLHFLILTLVVTFFEQSSALNAAKAAKLDLEQVSRDDEAKSPASQEGVEEKH